MREPRDTILRHHRELRRVLRSHLGKARRGTSSEDAKAFVEFLTHELLPHARGEERAFYPVMDDVLREHGQPTRTMSLDHERIVSYITHLSRITERRARARGTERTQRDAEFDQLASELGALLELHFDKENRAYLPLFARYVPLADQRQVLARMHERSTPNEAPPPPEGRRGPSARRGIARARPPKRSAKGD